MKARPFVRMAGLPVMQGFHQLIVHIRGGDLEEPYAASSRVSYLELNQATRGVGYLNHGIVT